MAEYVITSPAGEKFKITAPDDASQEQVLAFAQKNMPQAEAPQQGALDAVNGLAQNVAQGATMGWGDEIGSNLAKLPVWALKNMLPQGMGGEDVSLSQVSDYMDKNKANVMQPMTDFNQEHPVYGALAQMAGGVASGVGLGKLAGAVAPGKVSALQTFAKANPYTASAGLGGGAGAVYGAGASEGGLEERGAGALVGGLGGAALSLPLTFAGRNIVGPALSKLDDAYQGSALQRYFADSPDAPVATRPETAPANIAELQKPSGEFFSKTAGERTQKANLQSVEADAVGGRYGDEPRAMLANARSIQNQERRAFISALSDKATDETSVNDVLDGIYARVKGQADTLGKQVTNAYGIARQGNSVKIRADDINTGLMSEIGRVRQETAVNLLDKTNYSKANAALDALAQKMEGTSVSKITSVKLGDLEDWRKTLTAYHNDAQGSEKHFLGEVKKAYDNFMIKTANEAADLGDAEAIKAFRSAVGLRAEFGQRFESNAITEAIANGASPDDFAKSLIGSGAINGKKGMMDNVQALIKAGGADGEAVKADISHAFAKRLFTKAANGFEEGRPDMAFISPAKMASGLEELFVTNKELGNYLFGEGATKAAKRAISELKMIASKQPSTQNPSGSGYVVARILRASGITKIPVLSFLNDAANSAGRARGQAAVERALNEFVNSNSARSALFSGAGGLGGGLSAGVVVNENKKK